jgi:hypothetical protein
MLPWDMFEATDSGNPESVIRMIKIKSYVFEFHRRYQGQSMAEFCVAAPVLVLLLWSILYLADMYIVKHKTLVAARYGTWLLSRYDNVPENRIDFNQVEDRIKKKFFGKRPQQNVLIEEQHIGTGLDDFTFFENGSGVFIDWVFGFLSQNLLGANTPSIYSLKVKYNYPRVFGAVDLREGNHNFFGIQSEHFVLGNSWDGQRTEVHDLVEMIEERAGDIIEEALDNLKF